MLLHSILYLLVCFSFRFVQTSFEIELDLNLELNLIIEKTIFKTQALSGRNQVGQLPFLFFSFFLLARDPLGQDSAKRTQPPYPITDLPNPAPNLTRVNPGCLSC
jgi:hypothetical protein